MPGWRSGSTKPGAGRGCSVPNQEEERCPYTGKITYRNPQRAWAAARKMNRKRGRRLSPGGQRRHSAPYTCDQCHQWHIHSHDKQERKAKE